MHHGAMRPIVGVGGVEGHALLRRHRLRLQNIGGGTQFCMTVGSTVHNKTGNPPVAPSRPNLPRSRLLDDGDCVNLGVLAGIVLGGSTKTGDIPT